MVEVQPGQGFFVYRFVEVLIVDDILSLVYPYGRCSGRVSRPQGGVGVLLNSEGDVVAAHDAVDSRQHGVQGKSLKHGREWGNKF
jgi:hypothetical protein